MSGIRGKHTQPELLLRRFLLAAGIRYRLYRKDLPGRPDIVVPARKAAILVHGCFWHAHEGCRFAARPSTRPEFWEAKLRGNVARDEAAEAQLIMLGWRVLVVWECATRDNDLLAVLREELLRWLASDDPWAQISEDSLMAPPGRSAL